MYGGGLVGWQDSLEGKRAGESLTARMGNEGLCPQWYLCLPNNLIQLFKENLIFSLSRAVPDHLMTNNPHTP